MSTQELRCELSDLLISECGCRIHAKTDLAPDFVITARFKAHFNSRCGSCNGNVLEGDSIARTSEGEYICEKCAS